MLLCFLACLICLVPDSWFFFWYCWPTLLCFLTWSHVSRSWYLFAFLGCADTVVEVLTCTVSISLIAFLSLHFLGFVSTPLSMSMGTYYCSSHLSCIFVSRFTCCVDIPAVYVLDLCIYLMNYLTIWVIICAYWYLWMCVECHCYWLAKSVW